VIQRCREFRYGGSRPHGAALAWIPNPLTFSSLDARIESLPEHPASARPGGRVGWASAIAIAAAVSALLLLKVFPGNPTAVVIALALMAVEMGAFAVAMTATLPTMHPARERQEYAEVLDHDLPHYQAIIAWIGQYPREQRQAMAAFASHRLERFRSKLPLLTGSMEGLGVLPLLGALFLQFKDMHWPPHPSWPEVLLISGLMLFYWLSLLQISVRWRLELYDALLKKSLAGP